MCGLPLVGVSGGHSSSRCTGLSPPRPLLLRSTGSTRAGSVVVAHGPSRSVACGIFPDQGSNPCPLHWQADSQPLHHQGSPIPQVLDFRTFVFIFLQVFFWFPLWYETSLWILNLTIPDPSCHTDCLCRNRAVWQDGRARKTYVLVQGFAVPCLWQSFPFFTWLISIHSTGHCLNHERKG